MRLFKECAGAIVALVPLVMGGCAWNASPADGLRFQAPAGWRSSPGIMGFMQFWRPPGNDREVLILFKSPRPLKPNDVFSGTQSSGELNGALKNLTLERQQRVVICGHQPAIYGEARGTSAQSGDSQVEMLATNLAGGSYFAIYVRPFGAAPNADAQAALRELCPKL
jgi:hypothetical protein